MTFAEWAALQDTEKIFTAVLTLKKISDGTTQTLYLCTHPRIFGGIFYEPVLKGIPRFSRKMQEVIYGASLPSWGDLEIDNSEGQFDSYLTGSAWDGRSVVLKVGGDPLAWADYQTILSGVMGRPKYTDQAITLPVFDNQERLQVIVCSDLFTSASYPNMAATDLGKPIPLAIGTLKNIRPYCTNASTKLPYKVSKEALKDITTVYDNGSSVAFTKDLANGAFTLSGTPSGTVTCDVQGKASGGVLISLLGNIISDLLTSYAGFSAGEIDTAVLAAFNTDCPYDMGYYIDNQDTVLAIIDKLIQGCNAFYGFSRTGKFQIYQFKAPSGSPALTLSNDMEILEAPGFTCDPSSVEDIYWQVVLKHTLDWANNTWSRVSSADASIKTTYLTAKDKGEIETYIVSSADAQAAADQFISLWKSPRAVTSVALKLQPLQNNLGDVVSLSRSRFGLSGGGLFRIIGLEEDYTNNQVLLDLWA